MLAVVRKPPESIQMPLSLFLRMPIITSAVMPPVEEDMLRGPRGGRGTSGLGSKPWERREAGTAAAPQAPSPLPSPH